MDLKEAARGCWMHKPPSTSKGGGGGILAALISKKWSRRWVWTTDSALHYSAKRPTSLFGNIEINTVPFSQVLEARAVATTFMSEKGAGDDFTEHGWVLRTNKKDILWGAPDPQTRDRFVTFFAKYRQWSRLGFPEEDSDAIHFLRQNACARSDVPSDMPTFSDTASTQLETQSSAAFDLDHDEGTRYWDAEQQLDGFDAEPADEGDAPPASSQRSSVSTRQSSTVLQAAPQSSTAAGRDEDVKPSSQQSSASSKRLDSSSNGNASRRLLQPARSERAQYPPVGKSFGDVRSSLEAKIEERKRRVQTTSLSLSLKNLVEGDGRMILGDESASPTPRTFAKLANRRRSAATAIRTTSCADNNRSPLCLSLAIVGQFTEMLERTVMLDKASRITGSAVGSVEGLMLRCVGDMDQVKFARCTTILRHCEGLHPKGYEPLQVVVEEEEGRHVTFSTEFGAYVVVQVQRK